MFARKERKGIVSESLLFREETMHTGDLVVFTTFEKREDAERALRALVEQRLAACVQIVGPMTSIYRWKGKIETASELLCLIKTRRALFPQLEQTLTGLHPYEVPQIVAVPIEKGNAPYLRWLEEETASSLPG